MIHVVDFEKTAFSTPFPGVLPPSGPQIIAESGMGYPLLGTRETRLAPNVHLATVLPPHAPRRDERGQVVRRPFPAGYCLTPTGRVAGRYCYLPAPSEPYLRLSPHTAQAFTKAPCGARPLLSTAFTIRAWSRRTVCQTFFHSMECQSGARSGAALAGISAANISACLPESVGQGSLVTEHLREVSPLSR